MDVSIWQILPAHVHPEAPNRMELSPAASEAGDTCESRRRQGHRYRARWRFVLLSSDWTSLATRLKKRVVNMFRRTNGGLWVVNACQGRKSRFSWSDQASQSMAH